MVFVAMSDDQCLDFVFPLCDEGRVWQYLLHSNVREAEKSREIFMTKGMRRLDGRTLET